MDRLSLRAWRVTRRLSDPRRVYNFFTNCLPHPNCASLLIVFGTGFVSFFAAGGLCARRSFCFDLDRILRTRNRLCPVL